MDQFDRIALAEKIRDAVRKILNTPSHYVEGNSYQSLNVNQQRFAAAILNALADSIEA